MIGDIEIQGSDITVSFWLALGAVFLIWLCTFYLSKSVRFITLLLAALIVSGHTLNKCAIVQPVAQDRAYISTNHLHWLRLDIDPPANNQSTTWRLSGLLENTSGDDIDEVTISIAIYTCKTGWTDCETVASNQHIVIKSFVRRRTSVMINENVDLGIPVPKLNWKHFAEFHSARTSPKPSS